MAEHNIRQKYEELNKLMSMIQDDDSHMQLSKELSIDTSSLMQPIKKSINIFNDSNRSRNEMGDKLDTNLDQVLSHATSNSQVRDILSPVINSPNQDSFKI